jgi:hypothetical protein
MADDSLNLADMNWRLVEDGREAMSRGDWMLALSLFEQSRRICIDEGWREGVHYADDMILNIYPMMKRQIDDANKMPNEKPNIVAGDLDAESLPHQELHYHAEPPKEIEEEAEDDKAKANGDEGTNVAGPMRGVFDENRSNRRLRRIINPDNED